MFRSTILIAALLAATLTPSLQRGVYVSCPAPILCPCSTSPADLQRMTVQVRSDHSWGSGVLFRDSAGHVFVLTAAHVVENSRTDPGEFDPVQIRTVTGQLTTAIVVRYSESEDVALLYVEEHLNQVLYATLATNRGSVGDRVWLVGCPLGPHFEHTVTDGVISFIGRNYPHGLRDQHSAPGLPGCSGCGIYASNGQVLGIYVEGVNYQVFQSCFGFYVPARSILNYANRADFCFLFHGGSATLDELLDGPVEDD